MSLFAKKENKHPNKTAAGNGAAVFKVLGSGCKKCQALEANVRQACEETASKAVVEHVTDFSQIAAYGVMSTPALVLNDEVISSGKVLSAEDVKIIIQEKLS
ncbi:thioredoxin family protein [Streptococcus caviae]|uniref:thioredoxin family protein n=1 Tax=Streptococcus sp. 'caviae' TaxID=1915004 RepID=UPI00094B8A32|nr:thioredoxin family protein [Streptococcus sp. 'caviae']OLN82330.1 thioredoxin family protein [Streptococcus sp. 'caviae']